MDPRRSERLSEAIREELEEIIRYELSDPRIDIEAISEVLLSPDSKQAHVRLLLHSDAKKQAQTLEALTGARGFLRSELGSRLDLFRVPDLHFESALSAELGPRVEHLLKRVKRGRPRG
jgi:ribosome-binding factor A